MHNILSKQPIILEILDNINDALFIHDFITGEIIEANQQACNMYGYIKEEIKRLKIEDLSSGISPYTQKDALIYIQKSAEGKHQIFEWHARQKNGMLFWVEVNMNFSTLKGIKYIIVIERNISERKLAEKALIENESYFRSLFENSTDLVRVIDSSGIIKYISPSVKQILGYEWEELAGKSEFDLIHPEDVILVKERWNIVTKTFGPIQQRIEVRMRHADGSWRYHEVIGNNLLNDPIIKGFVVNSRDITEKKKIDIELREIESRYRMLFDNNPNPMLVYDKTSLKILAVNDAIVHHYGYSRDEFLTMSIKDMRPPEEIPVMLKVIGEAKNLVRESGIWKHLKKDGTVLNVEITSHDITHQGHIARLVLINDVTERKKVEDALRGSEEIFRLTFKTSPDSVNINRLSDGMYVEINEGFSRIMGYTENDAIGKTSLELNIWADPTDRKELIMGLNENGYCDNLEAKFRKKNGTVLTGLMSARIINLKGEPHIISITRDISDRKLAEEKMMDALKKAEQADSLKTQFLYNMSHEIRTPMNAICGFADLLCNPDLPYEKQQKYSGIIQRRTNDLLMLIEDILDISKIEVNQLQLKETSDDINELLKDLYQTWANFKIAGEIPKNISWKVEYGLIPPENYVITDFFRLRQVLTNLLSNAYKYTEEGLITFGCFLNEKKELQFYVKDTGVGIPIDKYEIIFDRFRQLEEGYLNRKSSGTGLGLSIVKGLIKMMNGRIWLESKPDKGSIFHFTLPYYPEMKLQNNIRKEISEKHDWSDKSILIVEDNISNTELIKALLEDYNFKLYYAETGKECLEIIIKQKQNIDLILMDIRLPDLNGLDLTRRIKVDNPDMPVIAQTAYATSHDLAECLNAGCNNYISKPLIREKLIEKILLYINV